MTQVHCAARVTLPEQPVMTQRRPSDLRNTEPFESIFRHAPTVADPDARNGIGTPPPISVPLMYGGAAKTTAGVEAYADPVRLHFEVLAPVTAEKMYSAPGYDAAAPIEHVETLST